MPAVIETGGVERGVEETGSLWRAGAVQGDSSL